MRNLWVVDPFGVETFLVRELGSDCDCLVTFFFSQLLIDLTGEESSWSVQVFAVKGMMREKEQEGKR